MGALEDVAEGDDFTGGRGTVLMRAASTVWCVSSAVRSARVRSRRCLRPCGDVIRDVVGDGELLLASWQKWDEACAERQLHPVEYLRYEDEGHGLAKLKNRLDAYPKMVAFLDRYLK